MDFYADLDQLAYQYERLADEEKANRTPAATPPQ